MITMKYTYTKIFILSIYLIHLTVPGAAQEKLSVAPFEKITVSPHIQLLLEQGDEETVSIGDHVVPLEKINIKVEGKNLHIYLDDAKMTTKQVKHTENGHTVSTPIYKGTQAVAHVHYKTLNGLSIRGEETASLLSPIVEKKFTINLYGESKLNIDSIQTNELKATLYGDNHLSIHKGAAISQVFKSYGDSKVDAPHLNNDFSKVTSYGDNTFNINSKGKIKVWAFGDAIINYSGDAEIQRLITIGEVKVNKIN